MSILSSVWKTVQTVAKPFVNNIPIVGPLAASRINMSPTAGQTAAATNLGPTADDVAKQIQGALEAERVANAKAAADAQAARDALMRSEQERQKALQAPPATAATAGMSKDQMLLYGGIAAALLLVLVLGNRR